MRGLDRLCSLIPAGKVAHRLQLFWKGLMQGFKLVRKGVSCTCLVVLVTPAVKFKHLKQYELTVFCRFRRCLQSLREPVLKGYRISFLFATSTSTFHHQPSFCLLHPWEITTFRAPICRLDVPYRSDSFFKSYSSAL